MSDKHHKISRYIVDICLEKDIGTVIVGKNDGWKQEINIGKKNNQTFSHLPHAKFIAMLEYKLRGYGVNLTLQEESYTIKASFLDQDIIPTYNVNEKKKHTFSGRRIKRGLYKSSDGTLFNTDINGAGNIARKAGYEGASLVSGVAVNAPMLIGV